MLSPTPLPLGRRKSRADRVATHLVTRIAKPTQTKKPSAGRAIVADVIREIAGFAPYEKRAMELMKVDTVSCNKRAFKLLKKRLGKHASAKVKRDQLRDVVIAQKRHH